MSIDNISYDEYKQFIFPKKSSLFLHIIMCFGGLIQV